MVKVRSMILEQVNNGFIVKLVSNFDDVEERRKEREESLTPN